MYKDKLREYERKNIPSPGNPQYNEAWALIEAARRMAAVIEYGDLNGIEDKRKLRDSLRLNLRIWTIIQAEQIAGERPLPDPIRQNILTLCQFIDKQTIGQMSYPSAEGVAALININRNIALGLLGNTSDEEQAAAAAALDDTAPDGEAEKPAPLKIET